MLAAEGGGWLPGVGDSCPGDDVADIVVEPLDCGPPESGRFGGEGGEGGAAVQG